MEEKKKRVSPAPALSVREERRREKNSSDEQYRYRGVNRGGVRGAGAARSPAKRALIWDRERIVGGSWTFLIGLGTCAGS